MKNRISLLLTFVSLLALTLMNCGGDDTPHIETLTEVSFLATTPDIVNNRGTANQSSENEDNVDIPLPTLLKMTIENTAGETVFSDTLSLLRIGTGFQTDAIKLPSGQEYHIVEFLAFDENTVLYAAPKEGSDKAQFVGDPLPVTFSLGTNQTLVEVEVLQVEDTDDPSDYGYFSVRFDLQTLFYWRTIVFKINNETSELETVLADLTVTLENGAEFTFDLDHGEHRLPILPSNSYELLYEVEGFDPIKVGLSRNELLSHEDSPLAITFAKDDNPGGNPSERIFDEVGIHDFIIPNHFLPRKIIVELFGAGGGGSINGRVGGDGGYQKVEINVEPGDAFKLVVGSGGLLTYCQGVANGGGGGGLAGIFKGSPNNPDPFSTALAVAAGGGGASAFGDGCDANRPCTTQASQRAPSQSGGAPYGGRGLSSGNNTGQSTRGGSRPTFEGGMLKNDICDLTPSGGFGSGGGAGGYFGTNRQRTGGGGGGAGWPGGYGGNHHYPGEAGKNAVAGGIVIFQDHSTIGGKGGSSDGEDGKIVISW